MKSRALCVILLASSAAACAPAAAPVATEPRSPAAAPAEVPPVRALISERERLSLTPAQVAALDSIARDWDVVNDKLNRQMGALRGKRPAGISLALRPGARPARDAIAQNNRRAAEAVEQVLTPEQRQAACALQQSVRAASASMYAGKPAGLPGILGLRSEGGAIKASRDRASAPRAWHWCTATRGSMAQSSR